MVYKGLIMARREYSKEFRVEAVKQVTENDYSIAETDLATLIRIYFSQ